MADRQLISSLHRVSARIRVAPWWAQIGLTYFATRLLTFAFFLTLSLFQGRTFWTGPHPSYFDYLNIWDAEWYQRIFDHGFGEPPGYPFILPVDGAGNVQQNAWAFMPVYPLLVKAISVATGFEWKVLAPLLSTAVGYALCLVIFKLLKLRLDERTASWAVLLFCLAGASPMLQVGYAESLGLLWLALGLYFLMQHRYLRALPFLALLSLTRPGMVAFAMMLAGMWIVRLVKHRRGLLEFERRERWQLGALTVISGALGFAWFVVAWAFTGRFDAYVSTELAWRLGYTGHSKLIPFEGWWISFGYHFGNWFGPVLLVAVIAVTTWMLLSKPVAALGNELRLWCASYIVYLLLVFFPQSSTWRILLPVFPLYGALAVISVRWPKWGRALLVAAAILTQLAWLATCWYYQEPDYTVP